MKLYRYYLLEKQVKGFALAKDRRELEKLLKKEHGELFEKEDLVPKEMDMTKSQVFGWRR